MNKEMGDLQEQLTSIFLNWHHDAYRINFILALIESVVSRYWWKYGWLNFCCGVDFCESVSQYDGYCMEEHHRCLDLREKDARIKKLEQEVERLTVRNKSLFNIMRSAQYGHSRVERMIVRLEELLKEAVGIIATTKQWAPSREWEEAYAFLKKVKEI